jgi:hypothetical protein
MKYKKTELGKQAFKDRSVPLSARQRSAFIMFDGEKDDTFVFNALAGVGLEVQDIAYLLESGLIEAAEQSSAPLAKNPEQSLTNFSIPSSDTAPQLSDQDRYKRVYPVAIKLTSSLGLRGFRLNMSVEQASTYKELAALAPKIREAVGDEKFAEMARALNIS